MNKMFNRFPFNKFRGEGLKNLKVIKGEVQAISVMMAILILQGCMGCGKSSTVSLEIEVKKLNSEVRSVVSELREIKKELRRK